MSGALIGGKHRKNKPSNPHNIGLKTMIRMPRNTAARLKIDAKKRGLTYACYLSQIIIHRSSSVILKKEIRERVERYADRMGQGREEAANRLLNVALGMVNE